MAERTESLQNQSSAAGNPMDNISDAASRVRANIEQFVEDFNLQDVAKRVESFGRENPVGLALSALTVGLAVGILMRSSKRMQS